MKPGELENVLVRRALLLSRSAAGILGCTGVVTFLGWAIGRPPIILALPSWADMSPVAALGFALTSLSLCCLSCKPHHPSMRRNLCGIGLGTLVALIGAIKLADYLFGLKFHIDALFFAQHAGGYGSTLPAALAPDTASGLFVEGLGLMLFNVQNQRGGVPAQTCFLLAGLVGVTGLIGYSYNVRQLYWWGGMPPMSLVSAACCLLAALASLAARPGRGLTLVLTSRTTGGAVARRLLPMALAVPWVLGLLLLRGERAGNYPWEFTLAIFSVSSLVVFTALIWWNAELLYASDLEQSQGARQRAVHHEATRVLAETATLPQALPRVLEVLGGALDCQMGAVWKLDPQADAFRCIETWREPGSNGEAFMEACRHTLIPPDTGLPGRTKAGARPIWVGGLEQETEFPRFRGIAESGMHSAFSFPLWLGADLFGTMELFSRGGQRPEPRMLEMLGSLGTQLGLFIKRAQAEEQLRQATANLQRSNTELQQFAYVASHDLFEPLRMITSYLQLLTHKYQARLPEEAQQFISFAVDGAKRMDGLIHDLLAYSRVDLRGRAFEPVLLEQVFEAAMANLKLAIEESHAAISHEPLPRVAADPIQMTQLFQNLLGNGIKFHGQQPPRIEVGAHRRENDWLLYVKDNGIGIDPKQFERIFVIFQRLHTRQEYAGSGVGLAICKKIVERHGGRIWVESTPGRGSTFFFTLPVLAEERVSA